MFQSLASERVSPTNELERSADEREQLAILFEQLMNAMSWLNGAIEHGSNLFEWFSSAVEK